MSDETINEQLAELRSLLASTSVYDLARVFIKRPEERVLRDYIRDQIYHVKGWSYEELVARLLEHSVLYDSKLTAPASSNYRYADVIHVETDVCHDLLFLLGDTWRLRIGHIMLVRGTDPMWAKGEMKWPSIALTWLVFEWIVCQHIGWMRADVDEGRDRPPKRLITEVSS